MMIDHGVVYYLDPVPIQSTFYFQVKTVIGFKASVY
jgi:hypothetical protein